ncbi:MAG: hypothetical protein HFJ12_00205 [Bacilli bacterium]|nr:hypothetical protein [Bacilli bacterium]
MEQTDSKKMLLSVLGIAILVVAVVGISYAVFTYTFHSKKENVVNTGTISMSYTEGVSNVMTITNAMPTPDEVGMKQMEYFDFKISSEIMGSTQINYKIIARNITGVSKKEPLDGKYVRLYLERKQGSQYQPVLSPTNFNSLDVYKDDLNERVLYHTGKFINTTSQRKNQSHSFVLRMWLSSDYASDEVARTFKIRVDVQADMAE